jgi:hypothetical protein
VTTLTPALAVAYGLPPDYVGGTVTPPACPVCGVEVESYVMERPVVDEGWTEMVPLWEGGPLVTVPRAFPEPVYGRPVWTVTPCGHSFTLTDGRRLVWRFEPRPRPEYEI